MKTKLQFIALASLAVMGAGCLAVTAGVTANQNTQLSLNAGTVNETVGYVRLWITSETSNPINTDGCYPKLWIHDGSGNNNWDKGNDKFVSEVNGYGEVENKAEGYQDSYGNQRYRLYYYFDVPASKALGYYMTIQRFDLQGKCVNQTTPLQLTATNVNEVFYVWSDLSNASSGVVNNVGAELAAKAVEGLQTCSSSDANGFNAFPQIAKTFILNENGDWKLPEGQKLDTVEISDYASIDDYATGKRTITVNAYDKAVILARMSNVTLHKN